MSTASDPDALSDDLLFGGTLRLIQPRKGHRAGTDAVLLAAALPETALAVADLGAASGVVGLRAAQMNPNARVSLIERDEALAGLAQRNIAANGLSERVTVERADVFQLGRLARLREAFDCVLTNPPFHDARSVRRSPDPVRAAAHVLGAGETLDGWVRSGVTILAPGGNFVMIHVAAHVQAIITAMQARLGGLSLRFVHAEADQPAIRVIARGRKGSRAPLRVLSPLVLNEDGRFCPVVEALHRGESRLVI